MSSVCIDLPYPPSANKLWRFVPGKPPLKSAHYRAWLNSAATLVVLAVRANVVDGPFALHMQAGRPDQRRRDLDNLIKPILDCLVLGGAVRDDSNCQSIHARWTAGFEGIRVQVLATAVLAVDEAGHAHV